jgi:hypothetical protein
LLGVREVGMEEVSSAVGEMSGMEISSQEAWTLLLAGLVFAAFVQAAVLILTSVLAARRAKKKGGEG